MKQSPTMIEQLIKLMPYLYLLVNNVSASQTTTQHRDMQDEDTDDDTTSSLTATHSNDNAELVDTASFQIFNCEGMFLDWSGPSSAEGKVIVQYNYDLFIGKDSNVDSAIASIQNRIMRSVGREVFSTCDRRLLGTTASTTVNELSSAPSDKVTPNSECKVPDSVSGLESGLLTPNPNIHCIPVTGYISAYYTPSDDIEADEASINDQIMSSVENAMSKSDLTGDSSIHEVFYLGDRETYTYRSSDLALAVGGSYDDNRDSSWASQNMGILIGSCIGGAMAVLLVAVLYKKKRNKSKVNDDNAPTEDCTENEFAIPQKDEVKEEPARDGKECYETTDCNVWECCQV